MERRSPESPMREIKVVKKDERAKAVEVKVQTTPEQQARVQAAAVSGWVNEYKNKKPSGSRQEFDALFESKAA